MALSKPQYAYALARAAYDTANKAYTEHEKLYNAEAQRLGIPNAIDHPTIYCGILPEDNPVAIEAQRLLDVKNEFNKLMYAAAHNMIDWAIDTTLGKMGTAKQKADIRTMAEAVKKMSYVEQPWIKLVDISMRVDFSLRRTAHAKG